jgi:hypothetical protein
LFDDCLVKVIELEEMDTLELQAFLVVADATESALVV